MSESQVTVLAPAKINLFLELLSRRPDGFHQLDTVLASISLFDRLVIERRKDSRLQLRCRNSTGHAGGSVPVGPDNLVSRVVAQVRRELGEKVGFDITLDKRIPVSAGLGGGSSDAAAAFLAINKLLGLGWSLRRMAGLGAKIGSDVPFFFYSPLAVCRGRGERVSQISSPARLWIVLVMPPSGLSTGRVFNHSRVPATPKSSAKLVAALAKGDRRGVSRLLFNRLQMAASGLNPWIKRLQNEFARTPSLGHQMSGSGSSYFGLYLSRGAALRAQKTLRGRLPQAVVWGARTLGNPLRVGQPIALA